MFRRRISALAIVAGLMLPAVVGCLAPNAAQAQTMECCAQLECAQGHQGRVCFSTTSPAGGSQATPELRASLGAPSLDAISSLPVSTLHQADLGSSGASAAPQHSPLDLYTVHLALLI